MRVIRVLYHLYYALYPNLFLPYFCKSLDFRQASLYKMTWASTRHMAGNFTCIILYKYENDEKRDVEKTI